MSQVVFFAAWLIVQIAASFKAPSIQSAPYLVGNEITPHVCLHTNLALCTNDGYIRNMHRLHKLELPKQSSTLVKLLLLLICGDIQLNPGPTVWPAKSEFAGYFPCGTCELRVDWSDIAIECDDCNLWYHKSCVSMSTSQYDHINAQDASWNCYRCNHVNNSSVLYHVTCTT